MITIRISKKLQMAHGPATLEIDTEIAGEGITALYGASGAGKTTLMKIIAGLVQPEKGFIEVDGVVWLDTRRNIRMPVQQRHIGFVFQDAALFPNMTVAENLLYALGRKQDKALVTRLLQLVNMEAMAQSRPARLSGGQQQRIALARALIRRPRMLLMDEPLSALDNDMRGQLRTAIQTMQQQFQPATLLVTHDVAELHQLAGTVLHISQGKIINSGPPQQVLQPAALNHIRFTATVLQVTVTGEQHLLVLQAGHEQVTVTVTPEQAQALKPGNQVVYYGQVVGPVLRKVNGE